MVSFTRAAKHARMHTAAATAAWQHACRFMHAGPCMPVHPRMHAAAAACLSKQQQQHACTNECLHEGIHGPTWTKTEEIVFQM
jgi:hypothetical protein